MRGILCLLLVCLPSLAANRFWVGGGSTNAFNATTPTNWSATSGGSNNASVPGSADAAIFDGVGTGASDCTIGNFPTVQTMNFTGYSNTLTVTNTFGPTLNSAGAFTLSATMHLVIGGSSSAFTFTAATGTVTITSNGIIMPQTVFNGAGSFVLADDFNCAWTLNLTKGSFDAAGHNVTAGKFTSSNTNTRALTMGAGDWTLTGSSTIWTVATTTGLTYTAPTGSATLRITDVTSAGKIFTGSGFTYKNLTVTGGASSGSLQFTNGDTWGTVSVITGAKTLQFTSSTTTTIGDLVVPGASGSLVTINSTSAGTAATLSKASGTVSLTFVSIKDSTATGGATWATGASSANMGNTTGWTFQGPKHRSRS